MAVEEPMDDEEQDAPVAPKKSGSKTILIVVILLLVLAIVAVGGFIVYSNMGSDSKTEDTKSGEEEEKAPPEDPTKLGLVVSLDPFIVNLSGESGKRYLKVTMNIELANAKVSEEVTNKMPQIKDSIITVLSSKSTDELLTVEGKFKLKDQVLTRINSALTSGVVKNVYFVEFVIQ